MDTDREIEKLNAYFLGQSDADKRWLARILVGIWPGALKLSHAECEQLISDLERELGKVWEE